MFNNPVKEFFALFKHLHPWGKPAPAKIGWIYCVFLNRPPDQILAFSPRKYTEDTFLDRKWHPPPPFGKQTKNHPNFWAQASLTTYTFLAQAKAYLLLLGAIFVIVSWSNFNFCALGCERQQQPGNTRDVPFPPFPGLKAASPLSGWW